MYRKLTNTIWQLDQKLRKAHMKLISAQQLAEIKEYLLKSTSYKSECLITITFGSRQFGNRDNLLDNFLRSFLRMTGNPQRVEILLKIDHDDDLLFYYKIKKRYHNKINLRFLISDQGRGYQDVHLWHSSLLKIRSFSSRVLFVLTEDAEFCRKNWDAELLALINRHAHNFFIATPCSLEEAIEILGPNPVSPPVYWIRGADYPIFGMDILKCNEVVAKKYYGWTCIGNSVIIDGFCGDLLRGLWQRYTINLHLQVPFFVQRKGVFSWTDSEERCRTRTEVLTKFFSQEDKKVREEMVDMIYRQYQVLILNNKIAIEKEDHRPKNQNNFTQGERLSI